VKKHVVGEDIKKNGKSGKVCRRGKEKGQKCERLTGSKKEMESKMLKCAKIGE
jgi:hypothetical protein